MWLKRQYKKNEAGALVDVVGRALRKVERVDERGRRYNVMVDEEGVARKPIVTGVLVEHAGDRQKFPPRDVARGSREGWLELGNGKLILRGVNATITYLIDRTPGRYCCHCLEALDDEKTAKEHVAELHAGRQSPDPQNPSGYEFLTTYDCVREEA